MSEENEYATISKLRNQIIVGLITFGIFFPIAWFVIGWMVSFRLGGEVLTPALSNNPLLTSTFNNLSIETILKSNANQFGLNPMIGLVPTNCGNALWWIGVLSLTLFFTYFSLSTNFMDQTRKTCEIPSLLETAGQSGYFLIPFVFPAISFAVDYLSGITNETNFNPRKSNIYTFWGQNSIIVMVVILFIVIIANFLSLWGTCSLSVFVLIFAIFFTLLLGLIIYISGDVATYLLQKLAFLMGVEVEKPEDSFFMRYSWIALVGLPAYLIASFAMPVFMVQNTTRICPGLQ